MFIVFEGLDGSGTSTQLSLIQGWLDCVVTSEPSSTSIGKLIRENLKETSFSPDTMALLFAADRREHVKEIKEQLDKGKIVVCDRYICSSIAYQVALGVNEEFITSLNRDFIPPDLTIFFDASPELCFERRKSRAEKEIFDDIDFQKKVYIEYLKLPMKRIDASLSVEEVTEQIKNLLSRKRR